MPERGMLCKSPKSLQSPWGGTENLVLKPTQIIMHSTCSSSWKSCRHQGSSSLEQEAQQPLPKHLPWVQHPRDAHSHIPAPPTRHSSSGPCYLSTKSLTKKLTRCTGSRKKNTFDPVSKGNQDETHGPNSAMQPAFSIPVTVTGVLQTWFFTFLTQNPMQRSSISVA